MDNSNGKCKMLFDKYIEPINVNKPPKIYIICSFEGNRNQHHLHTFKAYGREHAVLKFLTITDQLNTWPELLIDSIGDIYEGDFEQYDLDMRMYTSEGGGRVFAWSKAQMNTIETEGITKKMFQYGIDIAFNNDILWIQELNNRPSSPSTLF